jgi:4-hydroxy-tetrahydrodipicolinate synthase
LVLKISGIIPPHITPFNRDEELDEPALRQLVHYWVDAGSDGLVSCGSNGEAVYMTREERKKVLEIVLNEVKNRIPVIAGTGSASTRDTIALTKDAKDAGADAALIVTPYYFIPNDDELFNHFKAVLDAVDIPIILYNVPKFTGYNMNISVIRNLVKEYSHIIGIKDSSGLIGRISELIAHVGDRVSIFAGTGDMILPGLEMGASGGIVAVANVAPKLCLDIYRAFLRKDHEEAKKLQLKAVLLTDLLVKKYNQISSIKAALNILGQPAGIPRKPSLPLKPEAYQDLKNTIFEYI